MTGEKRGQGCVGQSTASDAGARFTNPMNSRQHFTSTDTTSWSGNQEFLTRTTFSALATSTQFPLASLKELFFHRTVDFPMMPRLPPSPGPSVDSTQSIQAEYAADRFACQERGVRPMLT